MEEKGDGKNHEEEDFQVPDDAISIESEPAKETPPEVQPSLLPQLAGTSFICINGLLTGLVVAYTAVALPDFEADANKPFTLSVDLRAIFASAFNFTHSFGALFGAPLITKKFGRKWPLILLMVPKSLCWLLIAFPVNPYMMIAGRLIQGFINGAHLVMAQIYTTEIAHKSSRGLLLSSYMIMMGTGQLICYTIGSFVSWRVLALVNGGAPLTFIPFLVLLPRSPVWLLKRGREEEALQALIWLRGKQYDSEVELLHIQQHLLEVKEYQNSIKDILDIHYLKPLIIVLSFIFIRQFSGYFGVVFFTVDIFNVAGTGMDSNIATVIVGSVIVIFTTLSGLVIDKIGRKAMATACSVIQALSHASLAAYFMQGWGFSRFHWLPLVGLMCFVGAFSMGLSNMLTIAMGEMIPSRIKTAGTGMALATNNFTQILVLFTFEYLRRLWGPAGLFWLYTGSNICLALMCAFVMPETKGQSVEDIERRLTQGSKSMSRRATSAPASSASTRRTTRAPSNRSDANADQK